LALARGGEAVDDPRAWLDSLPGDVLTLWEAFDQLEPLGGEYQRHATQMETLDAIFALLLNERVPKNRKDLIYKPRPRKSYFPARYAGETLKPREKKMSPIGDQCEQYAKAIMGRKV
jgi:hypothetical protein